MKKFLLLFILAILSACTTQKDTFFTQNQFQTSVVLSEANFVVVKIVGATASRCFNSGIAQNAAIAELFKKADLKGSQAIANITVSQSEGTFCDKAQAYGTVIQFIDTDKVQKQEPAGNVKFVNSTCDRSVWGDACGN